jgi:hypothetical protein
VAGWQGASRIAIWNAGMGGAGSGAGGWCESERMQEAMCHTTAVMLGGVGAHSSPEDSAREVSEVVCEGLWQHGLTILHEVGAHDRGAAFTLFRLE